MKNMQYKDIRIMAPYSDQELISTYPTTATQITTAVPNQAPLTLFLPISSPSQMSLNPISLAYIIFLLKNMKFFWLINSINLNMKINKNKNLNKNVKGEGILMGFEWIKY